jgi:hypothetical protein
MTSKRIKIMKTTKYLISIGMVLMLSVFLVFSSCKKDDGEALPEDTTASFTLLSNGNSISTSMGNCSLSYQVYEGHVWTQLDLVANSGANSLTLTINNFDAQNPPLGGVKVKKYYPNTAFSTQYPDTSVTGGYLVDFGGATWLFNSKIYVSPLDAQKTDFVEVTSCDNYGKKVSGSYRFTVKDSGNPNDSLILSGYFKNQNYVVLNKK